MTRNKHLFRKFQHKLGGKVSFGENSKGKIEGIGEIGNSETLTISNVLYVDSLKYNLLSVSQLCDMGYQVKFRPTLCEIVTAKNCKKTR